MVGVGNKMGETVVEQICGFIGIMNNANNNVEDGDD
jgi:hypothetical protein